MHSNQIPTASLKEESKPTVEPKLHLEEEEIICPISHIKPEHPIIASDGHIYDAEGLREWLKQNKTSPITKIQLKNTLIPFKLLKKILDAGEPLQLSEKDLICPITKRFMRKPMLASDGILYEEDAIKKALFPRTPLLYEPLCTKDWRVKLLKQNPQLEKRLLEENAREVKFELDNTIQTNLLELEDDEPIEVDNEEKDVNYSEINRYELSVNVRMLANGLFLITRDIHSSISSINQRLFLTSMIIESLIQQRYSDEIEEDYSPYLQQRLDSSEDEADEDFEALPLEENPDEHPYRTPDYPTLSMNNNRDVVFSANQMMSHLAPQLSNEERSSISLKLEVYYGSPPLMITKIEREEAYTVTFNTENVDPKLNQYRRFAINNRVQLKITSTKLTQIDAENATTHLTLLSQLKKYLRQIDGADDRRVTAFFKRRILNNPLPKKSRIETLRDMLMKDLPDNFDAIIPTRQEHYPTINRNINQFQKSLNDNDNVLFNTPREPIALNYTTRTMSYISCGLYQPSPPQGQQLMQDINKLVKTNMRI